MKCFFLFFLALSLNCLGQAPPDTADLIRVAKEQPIDTNKVYTVTDQMPQFPGGLALFFRSFRSCLQAGQVPEACSQGCITFHLKFIVETDGSLSDISLRSKRCDFPGLEARCLEKLSGMPAWEPGRSNGRIVRTHMDIPLRIRVN